MEYIIQTESLIVLDIDLALYENYFDFNFDIPIADNIETQETINDDKSSLASLTFEGEIYPEANEDFDTAIEVKNFILNNDGGINDHALELVFLLTDNEIDKFWNWYEALTLEEMYSINPTAIADYQIL